MRLEKYGSRGAGCLGPCSIDEIDSPTEMVLSHQKKLGTRGLFAQPEALGTLLPGVGNREERGSIS